MSTQCDYSKKFPWINNEFVQNLIEKTTNDKNVILKSFFTENALRGGENFSSYMLRLKASFHHRNEEKEQIFILKIGQDFEEFAVVCEESALFEKEIEIYTKILPELENLLQSIGQHCQFAPRCYFADLERNVMVFEDLSLEGFKNVNKTDGLDADHMKIVLSTLAKYHAATSVLLMKRPDLFEQHTKKIWMKDLVAGRKFYKSIAKTVSNLAYNWNGYEKIADKIANAPDRAYDNAYKGYLPSDIGFNTLIHGDMWQSNIMFRHNQNGQPIDIRFVDFTLGKHSNSSIDLVFLLYSCSSDSLTQENREELIQFYHGELVQALKDLNYPNELPLLNDVQTAAFRVDWFNTLIVLFVIGLRYVSEFTDFMSVADGQNGMYSHPDCIAKLKYTLKLFDRRGYLDF